MPPHRHIGTELKLPPSVQDGQVGAGDSRNSNHAGLDRHDYPRPLAILRQPEPVSESGQETGDAHGVAEHEVAGVEAIRIQVDAVPDCGGTALKAQPHPESRGQPGVRLRGVRHAACGKRRPQRHVERTPLSGDGRREQDEDQQVSIPRRWIAPGSEPSRVSQHDLLRNGPTSSMSATGQRSKGSAIRRQGERLFAFYFLERSIRERYVFSFSWRAAPWAPPMRSEEGEEVMP